jgi:uncharacterized protein (DUF1697 family)
MRYAALLRGVNVGGKNALAMKQLASFFVDAGCSDVVTYIQSGNVAFTAPSAAKLGKLDAVIAQRILDEVGLAVPVVLRSAAELAAIPGANPFRKEDPQSVHVMFLRDVPAAADVKKLDPNRSPGDRFAVVGREVFLHLPNGAGRSKLGTSFIDAGLKTVSTQRNWNTLLKLIELTG